MGILPLQFPDGDSIESLGLTGHETIDIVGWRTATRSPTR
jgi:aconitate hydratase